jgi:CBS domain-containing protein
VPYAWLALGRSGRREQPLRTAQHNGLVFANVPVERLASVQSWFLTLGKRVVERLERCGFPLSRHGLLANVPPFCQSEVQWQLAFQELIGQSEMCVLPAAGALFDLHGVHEEMGFAESLRLYISQAVEGNHAFLSRLARITPLSRPPLGFLREYVVDKSGRYQARLDLKTSGLDPIVNGARVLALEQGLTVTSTLARLAEVAGRGILKDRFASDLREAYSFIMLLRVARHLEARAAGREPDSQVTAASLSKVQRKMLKDSFGVISQLQDFLENRYRALMVA